MSVNFADFDTCVVEDVENRQRRELMSFWGKAWYYIKRFGYWFDGREERPALPPAMQTNLSMLVASVFVREPNGSRTNIENHLEQELILRHAKVVVANQKVGMAIIKDGTFQPLATNANCSFVGTLRIERDAVFEDQTRGGKKKETDGVMFILSFRLFGIDGTVLISGTAEIDGEAGMISYDEEMRSLAAEAITYLDTTDVWANVIVSTTSTD